MRTWTLRWVLAAFVCAFLRGEVEPAKLQFLCSVQAPYGEWAPLAQFVSGQNNSVYTLPADQRAAWKKHAELANAGWSNAQKHYLAPIDAWRDRTLEKSATTKLAFYPFSGPDAANVLSFFPDAREYLLIGLEPVGCIPAGLGDYNASYFSALRRSLDAILTINFFRTADMQQDFGSANLRGVLPALIFMIARSGYTIVDVTRVAISRKGSIERVVGSDFIGETQGVTIRFLDRHGSVREMSYFSLNLLDSRLSRKPGTMKYLANLPEANTLIKSASYLLHSPYFSVVRDTILAKSRMIVEDDSGIPFRFFDAATWDVRLYGTYKEPITRFKKWHQVDLETAFASRDVRPLGFAIGYQIREANLMVAMHRGAVRRQSD
jgi:hypothetical protein